MCESCLGGRAKPVRLALAGREVACRAIIFDKDGTLVDSTGLQSRLTRMKALRAAAEAAVGPLQGAGPELARRPSANRPACRGHACNEQVTPDCESGCPAEDDALVAADDEMGSQMDEWSAGPDLLPGVAEMLATFQKLGLRMAIATGGRRRNAEATLSALGVRNHFVSIIGIDDVASGKPAPDMVFAACERLGYSPAEVIVVGDSPADLLMGRAAGAAACIGVTGGFTASERLGMLADALLPTAAALQELVVSPDTPDG